MTGGYGPDWWVVHWDWALIGGGFIAFVLYQGLAWWSDRRVWADVEKSLAELDVEEQKLWHIAIDLRLPPDQRLF